jgi:hypothetical protein
MSDISVAVAYTPALQVLIDSKTACPSFTHTDWSGDDLALLRQFIRDHYRDQQIGICSYCRGTVSVHSAANCHVEHIAPKSKYLDFIFEPKNLCVICADCNEIKRSQETLNDVPDTVVKGNSRKRYPRSSRAFKIVHPHFDNWDEHIEQFGGFYVDKSDKGHFTIGACRLNRRLREFGWEAEYDDADVATAAQIYLDCQDPQKRQRALRSLKKKLILV